MVPGLLATRPSYLRRERLPIGETMRGSMQGDGVAIEKSADRRDAELERCDIVL